MNLKFTDKVIIVTGASSGIGAAVAIKASEAGANVVIIGRNEVKLSRVSSKCEEKSGNKPLVILADISKNEDVKLIIDKTVKKFNKVDVLVNNAGFAKMSDFLSEDALEIYDSVMDTNLRGAISLTHRTAPYLIKTKGSIVNVSSIAAFKSMQGMWAYGISKAGLDHFTRSIAAELAPKGVRVNGVNPGPVKTDFGENMGLRTETVSSTFIEQMTALNRISEPEEIAELILFLASDNARGITGSGFVSDNGCMIK